MQQEYGTKPQKTGDKYNIILFFILLVAIICVASLGYLKSKNIDISTINIKDLALEIFNFNKKNKIAEKMYEIKYDIKEKPVFCVYNEYLIKSTKDYFKAYDGYGNEAWGFYTKLSNPVLKTSGSWLILADIGGKYICAIHGKEKKWEIELPANIVNVSVNSDGYVCVIHEAKDSKSAVTVFDKTGVDIFTTYIGERFVLSAQISLNSKQMVINSIDTSGVKASTIFDFFDLMGNPVGTKVVFEKEIFPLCWYMSGNAVIAVNQNKVVCFDSTGSIKWEQKADGRKILCSNISEGKYVIFALSLDENDGAFAGNYSEIKIYSTDGKFNESFKIDGEVVSIQAYDGIIALNTGWEVYFYNIHGEEIGKYSSNVDITDVFFYSKSEAAVVNRSKVTVAKFD